jgi:hypothetical protein
MKSDFVLTGSRVLLAVAILFAIAAAVATFVVFDNILDATNSVGYIGDDLMDPDFLP